MRYYIFDFDGTLADSMPYWAEKTLGILKRRGIEYPSDTLKKIVTLGDAGTVKYFIETFGITDSEQTLFDEMDAYALDKYSNVIQLKPYVGEYLKRKKKEGAVLCVLTASPHKMLDPCLKNNGVFDLFDHVWTCEDLGFKKDNPEIYKKAADILGSDISEIAFFDDSIVAVKTAKAAGLYTVGVADDLASDFKDEIIKTADKFVGTFDDLDD